MDDLLIRNGDVVDGTGAPARPANVVVRGDRIVAIEPGYDDLARRGVEARDPRARPAPARLPRPAVEGIGAPRQPIAGTGARRRQA